MEQLIHHESGMSGWVRVSLNFFEVVVIISGLCRWLHSRNPLHKHYQIDSSRHDGIRTRGLWVRSVNATSVLCDPRLKFLCCLRFLHFQFLSRIIQLELRTHKGCGGSSSGSTSAYWSRGPEFDSHWELGFFHLFSFLPVSHSISGVSLNRSIVEVQPYWYLTIRRKWRTRLFQGSIHPNNTGATARLTPRRYHAR